MKKPAIPSVSPVEDRVVASLLAPMKENIEVITGVRGGTLKKLSPDAGLSDVIAKVNEIIGRLNATG
jgi:hypothetical protein